TPWSVGTFSATFAPVGSGKLPTPPSTWIVRLAAVRAADGEVAAAAVALRLEPAGPAVAVLAVVIPAEHAASDRHAAQAARAAATFRYVFTALNLRWRVAGRMAIVSQACNTGPNPGTAPVSGAARPGSRRPRPRATRVVRLVCFDACRIRVPGARAAAAQRAQADPVRRR